MFKLIGEVTNLETGKALPGARVRILDGVNDVPLYQDENMTPYPGLLMSGIDGSYEVWVADGTYDVVFYYEGDALKTLTDVPMFGAGVGPKGDKGDKGDRGAAGNHYPSQAAGEAATATGDFFSYSNSLGGLIYAERTAGGSVVIAEAATQSQLQIPTTEGKRRHQNDVIGEINTHINQYTAVGENIGQYAYDATDALERAIAKAPEGANINLGFGGDYAVYRITRPIVVNRRVGLVGNNAKIIGDFSGANANADLITFAIPTETRRNTISGLQLGFVNGGRDALVVKGGPDGTVGMLNWEISQCQISAGSHVDAYAVRFVGVGVHFNTIRLCDIIDGVYLDQCADGNRITENVIGGMKGVRIRLLGGARRTLVSQNAIVSRDGGIWIEHGEQIDVIGNQFEQGYDANRASQVNAFSIGATAVPAHIILSGVDALNATRDINILRNNFGSGLNQQYAIAGFNYTQDVVVDENVFSNLGDSGFDIKLFDATNKYWTIGERNRVYGERGVTPRGAANALDPAKLLMVSDSGHRTIGYAARKGASALGLVNGWTASTDFAFWRGEDGRVNFEGYLINGTNSGGTSVGQFPAGYWTAQPQHMTGYTDGSGMHERFLITDGGTIYVMSAEVAGAKTWLYTSTRMQFRETYLSGPF